MSVDAMMQSSVKGMELFKRGKVRDVYKPSADKLLIVACDRISAFDHVFPTPIPEKGRILTQISNFWFTKTAHIIRNHLLDAAPGAGLFPEKKWYTDDLQGRTVLVRNARSLPIEAIVRGYVTGSGWKEYQKRGTICDIVLPKGLRESERLREPIFTPSTKATTGHDENISFDRMVQLVGGAIAEQVREISLLLYKFAAEYAQAIGILIADTKFEFGLTETNELILIDEVLTPDSSRFWAAGQYCPGRSQESYDKQFLRDYLESIGWNKEPPVPELPENIVIRTAEKYRQARDRLLHN